MVVLDTHVWLWLMLQPGRLSARAREAVGAGAMGICTVSAQELGALVRKGRVQLDLPVGAWVAAALAPQGIAGLAPSAAVAAQAGLLPDPFPGDPADRLIYATAIEHDARLVTADERIRAFDPARCVW